MDEDGAANIYSSNVVSPNDVIDNIDDGLQDSHDDELERRGDTKNNTKRNQEGSSSKICRDHCSYIYINIWPATRAVGGEEVNLRGFTLKMEEPRNQDKNFDNQGPTQEVQGDSREAVFSQECHQEPNAKEDHDVDILEHRIGVSYFGTSNFNTVYTFLRSIRVISGEKCEEQHNDGLHDDDGEDVPAGLHGLWSVSSHGDAGDIICMAVSRLEKQ